MPTMLTLKGGDGWREMKEMEKGGQGAAERKDTCLPATTWCFADAISFNTQTTLEVDGTCYRGRNRFREENHLPQVTMGR